MTIPPLHIVQGGIENGDKASLEKAARRGLSSSSWIMPKAASVGDDVVIYIGGYGFYATARVDSRPIPRRNWPNRYGGALSDVQLIAPAISLATVQRHVKELRWADYPRSITTCRPTVARKVKALIRERRKTKLPDLSDDALQAANIDELRRVALLKATANVPVRSSKRLTRARSSAIRLYVLCRANGCCEGCKTSAPFFTAEGSPYLEPHHTTRLADGGPDHSARVIALCPNCHRRAHYAEDAKSFNDRLIAWLRRIERKV